MSEEIIVFKIMGDWAHFKRPYTTTSPLTFDLPSPPSVLGYIGAFLGYDRKDYLRKLNDICQLSVALLAKPQKLTLGMKFLHTKYSFRGYHKTPHALIEAEFISEPAFLVYCRLREASVFQEFSTRLQQRTPFYIPSLGLAWCLSDFEWIGSFPAERVTPDGEIEVLGWLPQSRIKSPKLELGKRYHMMTLPVKMAPDRSIQQFEDMVYEFSGQTIRCVLKDDSALWRIQHNGKLSFGETNYVYLV